MVDRVFSFVVSAAATLAAANKWAFAGIGLAALAPWQLALVCAGAVVVGLAMALYDRLLQFTAVRAAVFLALAGFVTFCFASGVGLFISGAGILPFDVGFLFGICLAGMIAGVSLMALIRTKFGAFGA